MGESIPEMLALTQRSICEARDGERPENIQKVLEKPRRGQAIPADPVLLSDGLQHWPHVPS